MINEVDNEWKQILAAAQRILTEVLLRLEEDKKNKKAKAEKSSRSVAVKTKMEELQLITK